MQISGFITLIIAIIGLLLWFISSNPKVQELGKLTFFCGFLAFCLSFSNEMLHVGVMK